MVIIQKIGSGQPVIPKRLRRLRPSSVLLRSYMVRYSIQSSTEDSSRETETGCKWMILGRSSREIT